MAAWALVIGSEKRADITVAISTLVKALVGGDTDDRRDATKALENAAEQNHETRSEITKALMGFTNSDWFMREAEKNSDRFIQTITTIDLLVRKIDQLEKQAA
jgi:GTPase